MSRKIEVVTFEKSVTVASGAGSTTFDEGMKLDKMIITPPSATPTVSVTLKDRNSRTLYASGAQTCPATVSPSTLIPPHGNTIALSSASADGTYTVTLVGERCF
jgi:hypothetical protein